MNRPLSFNTYKELLPFGILLVSITAWGIASEWRATSNNALTNQRLDTVLENQEKEAKRTDGLVAKVDDMKIELTRIATLVDRADSRGLLGQAKSNNLLTIAAPRIAAITPAPQKQEVVYHTTLETKTETAGESATPAPTPTIFHAPTPTIAVTPQPTTPPLLCVIGICLKG